MASSGLRALALAVLAFGGAALAYFLAERYWASEELSEGLLQVNGRIEGDRITVGSKVPGRIHELRAREGDEVATGQLLVTLDDAQASARVAEAREAVVALDAEVEAAKSALDVLRRDVPLAIAAAEADVEQAVALLDASRAATLQATREARRLQDLAVKGTATRQERERAELAETRARAEQSASQAALARTQQARAQAELGWSRIRTREMELDALRAQRQRAQASLEEAQSALADLSIHAPADGTIVNRLVDEGEVVAAGAPLFELVNLNRLYLKVYVAEVDIGKVRLGLPARIYTDAFPERPFAATVRYIASTAEFTPKEVQTPDERVKLVFAVRLYLDSNPDHRLSPGMPADAIIRWKPEVRWERPQW